MRGFLSRLPAKIQILPLQTTKRIDIKQVKKMGLFSIAEIILERFPCNIRAAARIPRVRRQSRDGCQKRKGTILPGCSLQEVRTALVTLRPLVSGVRNPHTILGIMVDLPSAPNAAGSQFLVE